MAANDVPGGRFLDPGRSLITYTDLVYVLCPACGGQATVVPRPGLPALRYYTELRFRPRRLVCSQCGATRDWVAPQTQRNGGALIGVALSGPKDPFFGRPLWLQTPCCGHLLWAYNASHLDVLQSYVAADVRERIGPASSMLGRLPAWIKKANHRSEVLRSIDRLRGQLRRPSADDRPATSYERPEDCGPRPSREFYFRPPY
ncbi:hypothetical protein O7627_11605 [Solwaraspora sp. WMMD1047]|uniref:hypothetical protein n=1 Tax=Solwaraspora sp. WMMD1047 TaxID=3016102 RepID=UPI002415BB71|nr:hypothetical protein [Solwaraspora sp. WMMD1047]MDG4829945.1 hypothetical protein [Solwaraspora sp. WMMD1047]